MYEYANELYHWKYIKKRKMPNGKYQYYYNNAELDLFDKNATGEYTDADGTHHTVVYKQTDKLFSDADTTVTTKTDWKGRAGGTKTKGTRYSKETYKTQGKFDRARAKGEKYIFNLLYKNRNKK